MTTKQIDLAAFEEITDKMQRIARKSDTLSTEHSSAAAKSSILIIISLVVAILSYDSEFRVKLYDIPIITASVLSFASSAYFLYASKLLNVLRTFEAHMAHAQKCHLGLVDQVHRFNSLSADLDSIGAELTALTNEVKFGSGTIKSNVISSISERMKEKRSELLRLSNSIIEAQAVIETETVKAEQEIDRYRKLHFWRLPQETL